LSSYGDLYTALGSLDAEELFMLIQPREPRLKRACYKKNKKGLGFKKLKNFKK
jgi:hypothetical protein